MLVLSRRVNESIIINGNIVIQVVAINGDKVRLGIEAPTEIPVHRFEVQRAIDQQKAFSQQVYRGPDLAKGG